MLFWLYCAVITASVALLTVTGVWLARYLLRLAQIQDVPNARSNHAQPVPRGAGIALMVPALGFMMVTGAPHLMLFAALGVMVISFYDDLQGVSARQRIIIHLAAVILALPALEGSLLQGLAPAWVEYLLAAFLLLGFMNLYNFMDGIDGITSVQTISIGAAFLLVGVISAAPALRGLPADGLILAAAAAAFLVYNWHPASIFLGDSGSVTLGFVIGFLLLQIAASGYPAVAAILPAYYLVDGGLTLLRRLLRGEKIWEAHSQHAYQQAVRAGWRHDEVSLRIGALNLLMVALAVLAVIWPQFQWIAAIAAYVGALTLWLYFQRVAPQPTQEVLPPKHAAT
jgi:UDP-N-acetylmuramyl pentapeptide phosphotransferase/UDP-N-acetylglucosamine-1-phosphate transferase